MYIERKEDLAIYYWLSGLFTSIKGMTIVDGFPDDKLTLPTISVEWDQTSVVDFQLGDRSGSRLRTWYISIYAKNKSTRDEFAYKIHNELRNGIPVYEITDGELTSTKIGHLDILERTIKVVRIEPELVSTVYYRADIAILAQNTILQDD